MTKYTHNIQKPRFKAEDMTRIRDFAEKLNSDIEEFIHEHAIVIAERDFYSEDELEIEDFVFLDIMPVMTDMIFSMMKRDI